MSGMYLHKEAETVATLLARIKGEQVCRRRGSSPPTFEEPVPEPNRSSLLAFYRSMVEEDLSAGRIGVVLGNMYRVSSWVGHRPFGTMTKDDVVDLVEKIKHTKVKKRGKATVKEAYCSQTVESYKTAIKKFWKWLKPQQDPEGYPPEVSWIERKKSKNGLLPKDIWTPEEVNRVAATTGNVRERAFVLGLFGSGCRIGEFLPLRRKDVIFDVYSCQILVDGKTGSRRVRLTPAASVALAAWLDVHPNTHPDAAVWADAGRGRMAPQEHFTYDWAHEMLRRLARRAGIDKPIRPHLLRHSLATYYAPRLTEAVMNEHFGWRQGGRTAAIYTHLTGKQVDDQLLAVFGKKKIDLETNAAVDVVRCPRCSLENTPASTRCGKCGSPLSDDACRRLAERRQKADDILDFVTAHPEVMEAIRRVLAEDRAGAQEEP